MIKIENILFLILALFLVTGVIYIAYLFFDTISYDVADVECLREYTQCDYKVSGIYEYVGSYSCIDREGHIEDVKYFSYDEVRRCS